MNNNESNFKFTVFVPVFQIWSQSFELNNNLTYYFYYLKNIFKLFIYIFMKLGIYHEIISFQSLNKIEN